MRRIAIVTGAGSGIGKAVALGLLDAGYQVALAGRRAEKLEETKREAGANAGSAIAVPTDVAKPESVRTLFEEVERTFGRLDLLFNNAGTNAPGVPLETLTPAQWQAVVDVNLTGVFFCLQQAFALMKRQQPRGGRIINNGSISAHVPRPNSIAYTATKHAVTGLTKTAGLDGRNFDIVCGQIDIGNAATPMASKMTSGVPQASGEIKPEPVIDVGYVVRAVLYMDSLPLEANVPFMTVMAAKMPYLGRG